MKIIRKSFNLSPLNLATLRLRGRNFRLRVLSASRLVAQATQILNYSNAMHTKDSKLITFQFPNFVLFATFVVKCLFLFWLRLRRARFSAVNSISFVPTQIRPKSRMA